MNSVSYDVSFELSFMFRTMTEATMIAEQILARFNPSIILRYKELDIDIEDTAVPVELDTIEISTTEIGELTQRLVTTTFYIRAKANIYHPITNAQLIEKVLGTVQVNDNGLFEIEVESKDNK